MSTRVGFFTQAKAPSEKHIYCVYDFFSHIQVRAEKNEVFKNIIILL